jgi:hypothetical protein
MMSPLVGIAGVNSLLFGAYAQAKRLVSPYPELTLPATCAAGAIAGAVNAVLASPVEMLKIRMQGQYGSADDKRLRAVIGDLWQQGGFRHGIMRGYWVRVVALAARSPVMASRLPCYGRSQPMPVRMHSVLRQSSSTQHRLLLRLRDDQALLPAPIRSGTAAPRLGAPYQRRRRRPLLLDRVLSSRCAAPVLYQVHEDVRRRADVVKSRVQLAAHGPRGANYIADTFRTIYREEGWCVDVLSATEQ